jgi:ribonuclease E
VLEASTKPCPHCDGTGLMRTAASAGLSALRILEDEAARGRGERITLRAGKEAAVYVLNKKRAELADIEQRYGVMIDVQIDESFEGARMSVDSSGPRPVAQPRAEAPAVEADEEFEEDTAEDENEAEEEEEREARDTPEGDRSGRRRRRRRRGGRGRNRREGGEPVEGDEAGEPVAIEAAEEPADNEEAPEPVAEEPREGGQRRQRRRGRGGASAEAAEAAVEPDSSPMVETPVEAEPPIAETEAPAEPQPKKRRSRKAVADV